MNKILMALAAVAAMTGTASAADLAARPYTKAPVAVAPAVTWTGCYVGLGGGGAITKNNHNDFVAGVGAVGPNLSTGADGWLATIQGGCDYQFAGTNWLIGGFADYDYMDVKGDISVSGVLAPMFSGSQKQDQQWAVGARVGYLVLPQLLTYVSGGYTQGHWKSTTLNGTGVLTGLTGTLPGGTKGGWFIGTGDEYALTSFLPGLFWKTEYRYSQFDRSDVALTGAALAGLSETQKFREHSVRSELVYRFNWAGPVVAKY
jgi:outer membrane immunogenic protein